MSAPIDEHTVTPAAEAEYAPVYEFSQKKTFSDYLTAYGTLAAALGAAAAAATSYMQVRATQEQIRIAKHTEEAQLRAYINTELVGVKSSKPDDIFEIDFNGINRGLSPASKLNVFSSIQAKDDPEFKSGVGFRNKIMAKNIFLGSNQSYPIYFQILLAPDDHEATVKEAAKFLNEHGGMVFKGVINYEDIFGNNHSDSFCFLGEQETHYITVAPC